mmetsp:Transcript_19196/g.24411  ORF Transcript_19196/g.24411 Transcript_19196/m.24411 type:complete len:429 (+) Transcript_19196:92-1378(+)|eukprot:CAMPEP_0204878486 /NCGR_PEP_ID=MMETSP1348-20121228/48779_1 /ASSEMBLY_ACC=CAM_ASM_000700 /TAXON_ID=215587 /ORGANISM="Aplanochytrium stocchinoi, Strain GSBS06" /LENGTH=428 /DNA_ID=CAMNT_0052035481 /DNA_START=78 /DNA_END=1364 /DNA_ORIENTATION=-
MAAFSTVVFLVLCTALVFPHIAFRLPVYPEPLERMIASFYEARDNSKVLDFIPDVKWPIVSRGGHFQPFLDASLASKSSNKKASRYFEGWYYKMVSEDTKNSVIVIPGVFFDGAHEDDHAFIMVGRIIRDGSGKVVSHDATYHRYSLSDVKLINYPNDENGHDRFKCSIGKNVFTDTGAILDIDDDGDAQVQAKIELQDVVEYPSTTFNPNIMGFFSFLDATVGMECVHKVVAIDSKMKGHITFKYGSKVDKINMNDGRAYVEGDYGSEFPSKWIWMASNHFESSPGSSMLLSVASIPFPNEKSTILNFKGFLGFVYDASSGNIYRFGTYTGASVEVEGFNDGSLKGANQAFIKIYDPQYIIKITAKGNRNEAALLEAPRKNDQGILKMQKFVEEMLDAEIHVVIRKRVDNSVVFDHVGLQGGLEIQF